MRVFIANYIRSSYVATKFTHVVNLSRHYDLDKPLVGLNVLKMISYLQRQTPFHIRLYSAEVN